VCSLTWNLFPHADVTGDVQSASLIRTTGKLLSAPPNPSGPRHITVFAYDPTRGEPLLQHPPAWPILGAAVSTLWGGKTEADAFLALRLLSLLSGILLIFLLYNVARKLLSDRAAALFAALWACLSALLIDYSGNGAFYMLHAALFLLWLSIALWPPTTKRAVILGGLSGLTYLVNYQALVLLPATVLLLLIEERSWRAKAVRSILSIAVFSAVASPWLIRNFLLTGDPFMHHLANLPYVFSKAGVQPVIKNDVYLYPTGVQKYVIFLSMILTSWLPNNSFYIARKLMILAPIAFIFMSYGLIDQILSKDRWRKLLPVFLLFAMHFAISASWPITKFRYFVPMLSLSFLLALEALEHFVPERRPRLLWMSLISVAVFLGSVLTYFSVPTHTYYYDGAITTDPFSGRGEWNYLRDQGLLPPSP
jgi:4-amino-4-deoxy-L-arabinose transferase-like glycosyltransferase